MPMYTYYCHACDRDQEQIKPIAKRDTALCSTCGHRVYRKVDVPGMVWSPTKSGGNHS
jgi:putative FmdB family regulatory protein